MPSSYAAFEQRLPPTAPSHSVACHLTSPTSSSTSYPSSRGVLLSHLVTARDDTIRVWEVRSPADAGASPQLHHIHTKTLFGTTTGLQATKTIESDSDGKDRLIVSFKDAKIALLEWDQVSQSLATISIHTYERASQLSNGLPLNFRPILSLDPSHRCAALSLPKDTLAILPFTSASDLDLLDDADDLYDIYGTRDRRGGATDDTRSMMPYTPSFVLPLSEVDEGIRNIRDVVFLPNFQKPTVAVLCESDKQTWTSSLMVHRDTLHLYIFTLDLSSTSHPVLSHIEDLPYDAMYLKPCHSLGGVFVVTPTNLFHVDQNGRLAGLRVNTWSERITTSESVLGFPEWSLAGDRDQSMDLSGSSLVWTEDLGVAVARNERKPDIAKPPAGSGLLFLNDGRVFGLRCTLDGRSISSIHLDVIEPLSDNDRLRIPPSCAVSIPQQADVAASGAQIFVGSMVGTSRLVALDATSVLAEDSSANVNDADMDLDDDADLYGDSGASSHANQAAKSSTRLAYSYRTIDTLPSVGPIGDLALAVIQDRDHNDVVKMVGVHGVAPEGGFVHFERDIQPRNQKILWADGQSSRLWNAGPHAFVAQQREQGQAEAFVFRIGDDKQPEQLTTLHGKVVDVKSISEKHFVVAFSHKLSLFDSGRLQEGATDEVDSEREGTTLMSISATSRDADAAHGVALIALTSDGKVQLFSLSDDGRLEVQAHELSSRYIAAHVFVDTSGATGAHTPSPVAQPAPAPAAPTTTTTGDDEDEVDYGDDAEDSAPAQPIESIQRGAGGPAHPQRLALFTVDGSVEIFSVSRSSTLTLERLWRSNSILDLPERLDGLDDADKVFTCSDVSHDDLQFSWIGTLGDTLAIACIQADGLLTIWTSSVTSADSAGALSFSKTLTKIVSAPGHDDASLVPPNGELRKHPEPTLIPVDLRETLQDSTASGLFLTGRNPGWLIKTRKGALSFYPSSITEIDSLTMHSTIPSTYLYTTQQGLTMATFPKLDFDLPIARTHYSSGRDYTHVRPYPATRCLVAASTVNTPFVLFDTEEGEVIRDLSVDPTFALSKRGSLELFKHDWNEPIDGYELDQNETVTALELLTLTSAGSLTGLREFIAVGTTIYNGEDRPTRGATYIFEVVETVPDQAEPEMNCRLKLLVKDDAGKGPVTALGDISGYLAVAVGQKLFIRAFENHESLIHVAFQDTYYLTTSIRRLGSTLLLSDLHKSITFIGFQEDPFKLTVFAHDYLESYSTTANYLLTEDSLAFVSTDWHGSLRLLEYNPNTFNNSHYGSRLNLKTEFQTGIEWTCSTTLAGPDAEDHAGLAVSNEILLGGVNGSLASVRPVVGRGLTNEATFNALNALQNQLVRSIPHTAALNPRGYRIVKNDWQSRPLNKGVLDVLALKSWLGIGRPKMVEVVEGLRLGGGDEAVNGSAKSEIKGMLKALRAVL